MTHQHCLVYSVVLPLSHRASSLTFHSDTALWLPLKSLRNRNFVHKHLLSCREPRASVDPLNTPPEVSSVPVIYTVNSLQWSRELSCMRRERGQKKRLSVEFLCSLSTTRDVPHSVHTNICVHETERVAAAEGGVF